MRGRPKEGEGIFPRVFAGFSAGLYGANEESYRVEGCPKGFPVVYALFAE
jgi:hypothetical protein